MVGSLLRLIGGDLSNDTLAFSWEGGPGPRAGFLALPAFLLIACYSLQDQLAAIAPPER